MTTPRNYSRQTANGSAAANAGSRAKNSRIMIAALILLPLAGLNPASGEDFDEHLEALLKKVPSLSFTLVRQPPFVVIGDETAEMVRSRAANTVKWAVDSLKRDYFSKDPEEIIDIWLFKDKESYETHTRKIFGEDPTTPFGYYSAQHHALIMNIATGSGTLVHEIVHPYMRANFPGCPPRFNEGMGALYEQSTEWNGRIRGLTNWRLAGLQQGIKDGRLLPFQKLTALNDADFYGHPDGYNAHYAQSRYLCYYLQEKELLVKFYREFVTQAKDDPTGFQTLKKVLGEPDMGAFQDKWQAFVAKLRFP